MSLGKQIQQTADNIAEQDGTAESHKHKYYLLTSEHFIIQKHIST